MSPAATIAQPHPDAAWQDLINGNARFVAGQALHPGQDAARRAELRDGQRPHTLVFGCQCLASSRCACCAAYSLAC